MQRRYESPKQRESYQLNGRLNSLLQHRITDHRLFLALRNAGYPRSFRPISGGSCRDELCCEQMGYEE
jgi:hypothetical protein